MAHVSADLLLDVYACADDAARWRGALDRIGSALGARSTVVQMLDRDGVRLRQLWCARDSFSAAQAALHDRLVNNADNPRIDLRLAPTHHPHPILRDRDMAPAGCGRWQAFRHRLAAAGLGEAIGLHIAIDADRAFALVVHRAAGDARAFGPEEEAFLLELAPHLRQLLRLNRGLDRADAAARAARDALDVMRVGVVLCDEQRRIGWRNRAARRLLDASPGLVERHGRLVCRSPVEDGRLSAIVRDALGVTDPAALGRFDEDRLHIAAVALPQAADRAARPIALLLSAPDVGPALRGGDLARLFGLSPAEGALAAALCSGVSLADHAARRGISAGTARIQLKRVLAKTDTHRQADLVRHVCNSPLAYRE